MSNLTKAKVLIQIVTEIKQTESKLLRLQEKYSQEVADNTDYCEEIHIADVENNLVVSYVTNATSAHFKMRKLGEVIEILEPKPTTKKCYKCGDTDVSLNKGLCWNCTPEM